jgi:TolA-binding protein
MTVRERPHLDDAVARLVGLAKDATAVPLTAGERGGLHRLERSLLDGARRGHAPVWRWRLAAGVICAAAVCALALRLRDRALTYEVTNATISDGGYVSTGNVEASVRFSDRSEIGAAPGTRLRVSRLEVRGARVMLEGGVLHVRIQPEPHASWTLDAGPYIVHVTGTEFDVAWRADERTLDVRLLKGSVVVEGPLAEAGVKVGAGQHLIANSGAGTLSLVDELNASPPSDVAPSSSASPPIEAPTASARAPIGAQRSASFSHDAGSAGKGRAEEQGWGARVARSDFDGVIADVERRGVDKTLAESTVVDLAALGDAARYARRQDLARRALLAQRARYPGSVQALDAPFFLGGLAEGQKSDASALQWYDVYLGESPNGAYASQALGRKMLLVHRLSGAEGARRIAADYLAHFPEGPYAGAAGKLLQAQ